MKKSAWASKFTLLGALVFLLAFVPSAAAALHGELDPSFGDGGRVLFGLGPAKANSAYTAVVRRPDGSLILAGRTESIQHGQINRATLVQARLPDGRLDPSFHQVVDGHEGYGPNELALLPDGDILYSTGSEFGGEVRRLNPDGTPDASWGKDGVVAVPLSPRSLTVDSAGRIVIGGTAGLGGNCHDCVPNPVAAVARLTAGGALDSSFGRGGTTIPIPPEGFYRPGVGAALEADGSIVLVDEKELFGLSADGAPSPSFGQNGIVPVDGSVEAVAETTEGDLIVAASSLEGCCGGRRPFALAAYRPDGSLDPAWGSGGKRTIQVADFDTPTALAPGPDGTVVLAGESARTDGTERCEECEFDPYVIRLGADGTTDPTFSAQGVEPLRRKFSQAGNRDPRVAAIALLPGGGVALAGLLEPEELSAEQAAVTQLSASGSPDAGFGTAGTAYDPEELPSTTQAKTLLAGPEGNLLATYLSNGEAGFEQAGLGAWSADGEPIGNGYSDEADYIGAPLRPPHALATDSQGRVYRGGKKLLLRLDVGGAPDPGYGSEGYAGLPAGFVTKALVVRPDGVALLVGRMGDDGPMALFELTPAGLPDPRFGKRGLALVRWGKGVKATALSAAFDRRGRIVLFGLYERQTPLARLLPNGRLDRSFGDDGRVNFKPELAVERSSISIARDGRIYLVTSPDADGETTLVRFREDGVRDRSFGTGGVARIESAPPLVDAFLGGRRMLLVSGEGYFHETGFAMFSVRLDGDLDTSFAAGGVYHGGSGPTEDFGVVGAVRQPDGKVVVAGTSRPPGHGEELELLRFR